MNGSCDDRESTMQHCEARSHFLVRMVGAYINSVDSDDSDGQTVRKEIHHRKGIANVCGKDNTTSNNMRNMARNNAYIAALNTYKQMGITGDT